MEREKSGQRQRNPKTRRYELELKADTEFEENFKKLALENYFESHGHGVFQFIAN